jgi:arylsulfatase A-like enzyme
MMVAPGVTKAEQRCGRPVTLLDVYPTLVDLCGLGEKPELEGRSLVPLLEDVNAAWDRPALTTHGRNNHSLRTERWRYIRYSDGTEELYDHASDALEWRNVAGEAGYADVKTKLAAWLPETNVPEIKRGR